MFRRMGATLWDDFAPERLKSSHFYHMANIYRHVGVGGGGERIRGES